LPGSYFIAPPVRKKRKEKKKKRKEKEKKKKRKRRREKKKRKEREREENAARGAARGSAGLGGQVHLAVRWPTGNFRLFLLFRDSRARG
jgi:transposase